MQKSIVLNSLDSLPDACRELLNLIQENKIVAFYGPMGVGKTTLIKVICEQLGVEDVVNSPTFSIVNEYLTKTGGKVFHFDFYRIKSEAEAYDMGYEEYFYSDAYCFIEWPENVEQLIPIGCVKVSLSLKESKRLLEVEY